MTPRDDAKLAITKGWLENTDMVARLDELSVLTRYGVEARYPGDHPPVTPDESRSALRLAELTGELVRGAIPVDLG
jgi:hypothetical protein